MNESKNDLKHDVLIKNRQRMEMTAVEDVNSYVEEEIIVTTNELSVSIEGENLKIEKFNSESGELVLTGTINGMFYFTKKTGKKKKSIVEIFK